MKQLTIALLTTLLLVPAVQATTLAEYQDQQRQIQDALTTASDTQTAYTNAQRTSTDANEIRKSRDAHNAVINWL
jgi:hypothetical protein